MKIPVSSTWLGAKELEYATDAIRSGFISGTGGKYIERFEDAFAKYCKTRFAVACSSGTTALQLAVRAAGIGPGDEVIVPTFTNIATLLAVIYVGAKPVLVDSRADTWSLDESKVARLVTKRTKAVIPVHIYGHPVDMGPLMEISAKHDLKIIEDAAEAHGAEYRRRIVGGIGDMGCFSFYANKIVTTGEGGMIVTNDELFAEKMRNLRNLAFGDTSRYLHTDLGYNFRLSNVLAAIGLAQMERIQELVGKKIEIAGWYNDLLGESRHLTLPIEAPWARNVYWMYGVLLKRSANLKRDGLMSRLRASGIDTRAFFKPMHEQPPLLNQGLFKGEKLPVSEDISKRGLYLPSGLPLTEAEVERVCKVILKLLND